MRRPSRALDTAESRYLRAVVVATEWAARVRTWWRGDGTTPTDAKGRIALALRWWVPLILVIGVTSRYSFIFARLSIMRHEHFGSFDYDLGMYDQGIWQLSQGRGFMTVRGMHVFGHHANIGYLLFVPFYWLGAGPNFLQVVNTAAVVAVAWPVYLLGRHHLQSRWAGFWLVVAYLFHFSPQWKIQETFHAESLAAPFLVGAFYLAARERWRWYWVCVFAALIWKEDVALAVTMLGFVVWLMYRNRRQGWTTIVVGIVWFLVATQLFMPIFHEGEAVYEGLFGELGASATEIVSNTIRNPTMLGEALYDHDAQGGALELMAPYGFSSVVSPHVLTLGAPQHIINFASVQGFTWDLRWHYAFLPYLAVLLAAIRTVVTRRNQAISWGLIAVMVIGVALTREQGVGPWASGNYWGGWWPHTDSPRNEALREAMEVIPDDADVSAPYFVVPHLSHREGIYTFPNPWRSQYYGVNGVPAPPDPVTIDYLIADENQVCPETDGEPHPDCLLWRDITDSGDFDEVFREDAVVVYRRLSD